MTLKDALNASEIGVAELWTDGEVVVVGSDEEAGGYEISFKVGGMPAIARDHAATVEEVERIVARSGVPYGIGAEDWEAREGD
jgi:hypothetical protein